MATLLMMGALLGLSAGFSPGPLLALVVSETISHDVKSGIQVALAPLITDVPIVAVTFFILLKLSGFHTILGIISLAGGCLVFFMGYQNIRSNGIALAAGDQRPKSLMKGVAANVLSPHPYLFWLSVGGPTMVKALNVSVAAPVAFLAGFYGMLVGAKILVALLAGRSKLLVSGKAYLYITRFLGVALCALALGLLYDGVRLLALL